MSKTMITLPLSIYNFFKFTTRFSTRGSDVPAPLPPRGGRDLP